MPQSQPDVPYAPDPDSAEVLANLVEFGLIADPFPILPSPWHEIAVLVDYVRPQGRPARLSAFIDAVARFPHGDRIQAEVDALRPHTIDRSLPDRILYQAREALHQPPALEWVLEGLLARPSLNLLVGSPGAKKTISSIDLAVCAALGKPWLGFKPSPAENHLPLDPISGEAPLSISDGEGSGVRPSGRGESLLGASRVDSPKNQRREATPVLYVDEEVGLDRFWALLHGILHAHHAGIDTPLDYICLGAHDLRTEKDADELTHRALKRRSRLIIIDTLSGVMRGGDENTVNGVGPVLFYLRRMAEYCRAAVLVLHHTNRSGFFRGSSALAAGVDLLLSISSAPQSSLIEFRVLKSRHAAPPPFYANTHFEHVPPGSAADAGVGTFAPLAQTPTRAGSSLATNRIWLTTAEPSDISHSHPPRNNASTAILHFLSTRDETTLAEISEEFDHHSLGHLRNALTELTASDLIVKPRKEGRTVFYKISEKGKDRLHEETWRA